MRDRFNDMDIDGVMISAADALTDTVFTCIERELDVDELDDHSVANRGRQITER